MRRGDKLKNYKQANIILEQSYLKNKGLVNEKITDYFNSREEIADKFLEILKENPIKALKSIQPYYEDFVEQVFTTYDGPVPGAPEHNQYPHSRELSFGKISANFLPNLSKIFVDVDGEFKVDKSKLDLVDKITKKEVLNLVSTHENFSLKKLVKDLISPFVGLAGRPMYKEIGNPEELDPTPTVKPGAYEKKILDDCNWKLDLIVKLKGASEELVKRYGKDRGFTDKYIEEEAAKKYPNCDKKLSELIKLLPQQKNPDNYV